MVVFHEFTYSKDLSGIKPFCTPYKITHKVVRTNGTRTSTESEPTNEDIMENYDIYMLVLLFYQYLIPLVILAFVYGKMSVILWETKAPGNADDERDKNLFLQKKKSVKMMVTVVVTFGLCWLPWHAFHCAKLVWPEVLGYVPLLFCLSTWKFWLSRIFKSFGFQFQRSLKIRCNAQNVFEQKTVGYLRRSVRWGFRQAPRFVLLENDEKVRKLFLRFFSDFLEIFINYAYKVSLSKVKPFLSYWQLTNRQN